MNTTIDQKNTDKTQFRKLGFQKLEAAEIVNRLNKTLSTYQVFFHKLQNFHWNVIGSDFFDVHDITEEMYRTALENIDEIAERIRVFGQVPEGNISNYLSQSLVKESSYQKSAEFMVMDITNDIERLSENILDAHECSTANGDIGTVFMLNKMIKELETNHWKLSSWVSKTYS